MSTFDDFLAKRGVGIAYEETGETPPWQDPKKYWDGTSWKVTLKYKGRKLTTPWFQGSGIRHDPKPSDVLNSLISDADGFINARDFEDWASELGFDPDSRKAEKIWRTLEKLTPKVQKFLGNEYEEFAEASREH